MRVHAAQFNINVYNVQSKRYADIVVVVVIAGNKNERKKERKKPLLPRPRSAVTTANVYIVTHWPTKHASRHGYAHRAVVFVPTTPNEPDIKTASVYLHMDVYYNMYIYSHNPILERMRGRVRVSVCTE